MVGNGALCVKDRITDEVLQVPQRGKDRGAGPHHLRDPRCLEHVAQALEERLHPATFALGAGHHLIERAIVHAHRHRFALDIAGDRRLGAVTRPALGLATRSFTRLARVEPRADTLALGQVEDGAELRLVIYHACRETVSVAERVQPVDHLLA